jgi:predicted acetyltransferase
LPPGHWDGCPDQPRRLGLEQVLIVCAADNIAPAKMIERP